jgi:hypothetical protein
LPAPNHDRDWIAARGSLSTPHGGIGPFRPHPVAVAVALPSQRRRAPFVKPRFGASLGTHPPFWTPRPLGHGTSAFDPVPAIASTPTLWNSRCFRPFLKRPVGSNHHGLASGRRSAPRGRLLPYLGLCDAGNSRCCHSFLGRPVDIPQNDAPYLRGWWPPRTAPALFLANSGHRWQLPSRHAGVLTAPTHRTRLVDKRRIGVCPQCLPGRCSWPQVASGHHRWSPQS